MGDFLIRLGTLVIGLTTKFVICQIEYGVLGSHKASVFIKDFLKQLLTDENTKYISTLNCEIAGFNPDPNQESIMQTHHRIRQFSIPIIEN
mmetsp:Transcript_33022/g.29269  ORF Transcript_33022/g.29269 Transcript_33022/m.29269 type:complete len:91 (+) Transcript_33022:365-637(+)